jgi:hypothetical protein
MEINDPIKKFYNLIININFNLLGDKISNDQISYGKKELDEYFRKANIDSKNFIDVYEKMWNILLITPDNIYRKFIMENLYKIDLIYKKLSDKINVGNNQLKGWDIIHPASVTNFNKISLTEKTINGEKFKKKYYIIKNIHD